jgi:molybdopterin converting factor small subunit
VRVEVRLFATLSSYRPDDAMGDEAVLEVPEGTTVGEVIHALKIPPGFDCLRVVNGRDALPDQRLADGDVLSLFPPLAGG